MSWSTSYGSLNKGITADEFKARADEFKSTITHDPERQRPQVDAAVKAALSLLADLKGSRFYIAISGHSNPQPGTGDSISCSVSVADVQTVVS